MSALRIVQPDEQPEHVSLEQLMERLRPEHFDRIERRARVMRETFACPYTVHDYDEFREVLWDFYVAYHRAFYNTDIRQMANKDAETLQFWKYEAYEFAEKRLGGNHAILTAERNAINGREGGMVKVADTITEGIIKLHIGNYVHGVFFERIEPGDFDARLRLASELLAKYGPVLFPGEKLLPNYFLGMNIEEVIGQFVEHIHNLRKQWRY